MKIFEGTTAFITAGATGIGLAERLLRIKGGDQYA